MIIKSSKKVKKSRRAKRPASKQVSAVRYNPAGVDYCPGRTITLRKAVFIILSLCMLATAFITILAGPSYGFEGEPPGWYKAKWGTEFDKMPDRIKANLTLSKENTERHLKIYSLDLSVASPPTGAEQIALSFFHGKFTAVLIKMDNMDNLAKFIVEAMSVFGHYIEARTGRMEAVYWVGKTTTIVAVSSGTDEYNGITIGSTSGLMAYNLTDPENEPEDKEPVKEEEETELST